MAEYIERELFIKMAKAVPPDWQSESSLAKACRTFIALAEKAPAADVRPATHAKWIWNEDENYYSCSKCGYRANPADVDNFFNYCPVCGNKMEQETE